MSDGEEKSEQPSDRKLKKARDDGQVATYKDFVSSSLSGVLFFYIIFKLATINDTLKIVFLNILNEPNQSFEHTVNKVIPSLIDSGAATVVPLCALAVLTVIVLSIAVNQGIVFSTKPLKPDLKRISPSSGFKKIFGAKAFVELGKAVFKIIVLGVALSLTLLGYLNDIIRTPQGGLEGLPIMLKHVTTPIIFISIGIFIILAVMDIPLQYFLFIKDQKSTKSEVKREQKESDGAPELKRERKRLQDELSKMPSKLGTKSSSLVIYSADSAVGMRYVAGETHVPYITVRARTPEAIAKLMQESKELKIPQIKRDDITDIVAKQHQPGAYLNAKYFNAVAAALREAKLV